MKKIYSHPWDFTLYERENEKILSVVFHNSFVDISKNFILNEKETLLDFEGIKKLSDHIRNNYELYKDREIKINL